MAVKGADNTLVVWDASSGEALCRAKLKRPSGMLFSRNGKAVVCATYDGLVALSPRTGATLATAFDGERIEEIVELSDGVLVMLGQSLDDGELVVVHPETLAEVRRVKLPGLLYPVAAGSVVVGRNESRNGLVLGDAKKGRIVRSTALTEGEIGPYAIAANGATVVVAGATGASGPGFQLSGPGHADTISHAGIPDGRVADNWGEFGSEGAYQAVGCDIDTNAFCGR